MNRLWQFLTLLATAVCTDPSATCDTVNGLVYPETVYPNPWKTKVCNKRPTNENHCCRRSVEDVMVREAEPNEMLFRPIRELEEVVREEAMAYRTLDLPKISEKLRKAALDFRILDNSLTTTESVVSRAAKGFLESIYSIDTMPNYCKADLEGVIRPPVYRLLQELQFVSKLVEANWLLVEDLFGLIQGSTVSDHCRIQLIQAGLTDLSCKSCTDSTVELPTCFGYCTDVVDSCLEPYSEVIAIVDAWHLLYAKLRAREDMLSGRVEEIRGRLREYVASRMNEDAHFFDVCRMHFVERLKRKQIKRRQKRVEKSLTVRFTDKISPTTRPITTETYAPTDGSVTKSPVDGAMSLFDSGMFCYRRIGMVLRKHCWNGSWAGVYTRDEDGTVPSAMEDQFSLHLPRLRAKLSDLATSLETPLSYSEEPKSSVDEDNNTQLTQTKTNSAQTASELACVLILMLSWIRMLHDIIL